MITMNFVSDVEGGQGDLSPLLLGLQAHDIIFATCSYYAGGNPVLNPNIAALGESSMRSAGPSAGDIRLAVWESPGYGTMVMHINSDSKVNLDLYAVAFRPSEPTENVHCYLRTKASATRIWTDPLTVYKGEWILVCQYASSGWLHGTPDPTDKGGTASVVVEKYKLPQGSTGIGNSFMELLRVTASGTFQYAGLNPSVMRVTIQGDPAVLPHSSFVFV